jgi:hypothetical protein
VNTCPKSEIGRARHALRLEPAHDLRGRQLRRRRPRRGRRPPRAARAGTTTWRTGRPRAGPSARARGTCPAHVLA